MNPRKVRAGIGGVLLIVAGGLMIKYIEPTSGAAMIAAGGMLIGALTKELFPSPSLTYDLGDKTPVDNPQKR